jgi:hypothetical protein
MACMQAPDITLEQGELLRATHDQVVGHLLDALLQQFNSTTTAANSSSTTGSTAADGVGMASSNNSAGVASAVASLTPGVLSSLSASLVAGYELAWNVTQVSE